MNRRGFFASLAAGISVAVAPSVFLPKLNPVHWKRVQSLWVPNPDWFNAPYEIALIVATPIPTSLDDLNSGNSKTIVFKRSDGFPPEHYRDHLRLCETTPVRLANDPLKGDGSITIIPPYRKVIQTDA